MSDEAEFVSTRDVGPMLLVKQLTALAQESRIRILLLLGSSGPLSVSEISKATATAFQNTSHHLQILLNAGLVEMGTVGRENKYRVIPDIVAEPESMRHVGGWKLAGMDVMVQAPEGANGDDDVQPDPVADTRITAKRRKRRA